jgi:hypothetical protein
MPNIGFNLTRLSAMNFGSFSLKVVFCAFLIDLIKKIGGHVKPALCRKEETI